MSDISDGYAPPYGKKLFIDAMDFVDKRIIFKPCARHAELRYAGDKCPVCLVENKLEDAKMRIAELEFDRQEL